MGRGLDSAGSKQGPVTGFCEPVHVVRVDEVGLRL
jgi:hypothetical protein